MKKDEFIEILRQHSKIEKVVLEKSQNCEGIWAQLVSNCYHNNTLEKTNWDAKIRYGLQEFADSGDSLDSVNRHGKILRRFAKYYKEHNGEVIPDNVMGVIGDILQGLVNNESIKDFYVDFTDKFDWDDGYFGKSGSCWWGCYSESLPIFQDNGGWCIRFYDENNHGIGRTWLFPDSSDGLLGFNSYGIERPYVSKVIKAIFSQHGKELHYSKCEISNKQNSNIPYVNGGTGFVLYTKGTDISDFYDLDMEVVEDGEHYICERCGTRLSAEDDEYNMIDDNIYCRDCTRDRFSMCDCCGEWGDNDDVHSVSDRHSRYSDLCENCASNKGYYLCSDCGKYSENVNEMSDTGNILCENCDNSFFCEKCEEHFEDVDDGVCPDCGPDEPEEETEPDTNLKLEQ